VERFSGEESVSSLANLLGIKGGRCAPEPVPPPPVGPPYKIGCKMPQVPGARNRGSYSYRYLAFARFRTLFGGWISTLSPPRPEPQPHRNLKWDSGEKTVISIISFFGVNIFP